ncbi:MAG: hypothetical protein H0U75_12800 [Legionella sp.]|nr:hypothetical protein [Legionella sp.]
MSGYTEIVQTLKEIRHFLQSKLTPQLMKSLQEAINLIKDLLGDPTLQANLKASLTQMSSLLQSINNAGLVNNVSGLVGDLKKADLINQVSGFVGDLKKADLINQVSGFVGDIKKADLINQVSGFVGDIKKADLINQVSGFVGDLKKADLINHASGLVGDIKKADLINQVSGIVGDLRTFIKLNGASLGGAIQSLDHLLKDAEKANLIQNIMKALESVNSFRDLVELAKDLTLPAKIFMYGTTGAIIGLALTQVIKAYLESKKDSQLQASIDKLIVINMQQLYVQIQQLRYQAAEYKRGNAVTKHQCPELYLTDDLMRLEDEATHTLAVLSPIDPDALELLIKAQEFGKKMLESLYQPELDNESMPDYLDRINDNLECWAQLVEAVAFAPTPFNRVTRPILPRDDLNYLQIKKLYGNKQITAIMQSLVVSFQENGGKDLYLSAVNSFEDSSYLLSESIKKIPEEKLAAEEVRPWTDSVSRLHTHYHEQTNQHITLQWDETNWAHLPYGKPMLNERVPSIIRNRALAEFCYQTAPFLCFPRNIPRDVCNGIIDVPMGAYQLVRHPLESISNIGHTLFTLDGLRSLGRGISSHPLRVISGQVISAGVGMGVSAGLTHRASMLSQPPAAIHGRFLFASPPPVPSSVASTMIQAAEKGGAVGSIAAGQGRSKTEACSPW